MIEREIQAPNSKAALFIQQHQHDADTLEKVEPHGASIHLIESMGKHYQSG